MRPALPVLFFILLSASSALAVDRVGIIEEMLGTVSITRNGEELPSIDIGSEIENYDLIKTGRDGSLVIGLDAGSGFHGILKIQSQSVFSVKYASVRGNPSTEGELLGGSVAVKVKKISGDPAFRILSGSTSMGIRGTAFEVLVSPKDSLLVACSEGRVLCSSEKGDEVEALPGQAVEQVLGERLRRVPVAVSSLERFKDDWITEEIGAFKAAPLKALDQYAATYTRYYGEFKSSYAELAGEAALNTWKNEFRKGIQPRAKDPIVMKQKSSIAPKLMALRRVMFLFERVYYRLDEVRSYLGPEVLAARLSSGKTVADFYRELTREKGELERKSADYRFALRLYAERNEGTEPVSLDADRGDFFDSDTNFFD
ncbi:hypothetical protein MASR2M78_36130 [Treponema sp.]